MGGGGQIRYNPADEFMKPGKLIWNHTGERRAGMGSEFGSLLWASPRTQAARFDAICRLAEMGGKKVLDVGCGRGDLMDFLMERGSGPSEYIGIEAVDELAAAAMRKKWANVQIVQCDFVREPQRMNVGADVVVFSGSLNTLEEAQFEISLRQGFEATGDAMVFNFLSAASLASAEWLRWHHRSSLMEMVRGWGQRSEMLEDYLDGDCTIAVYKS
jgi:precorrin-6B methylase 2